MLMSEIGKNYLLLVCAVCRMTSRVCRGAGGGAGGSDDVTGEIFSKTPVVPVYHHV